MARVATGIQRTPWGYRAFVRVQGFPLQAKSFRRDCALEDIKLWRERTRAKLVLLRQHHVRALPPQGTFAHDAARYLETVTALPTYKERVKHIAEWTALFGDRASESITPAEIRAQRDRWLTVGPKTVQRGARRFQKLGPLAASSVNHRLRALRNLFTVLWPEAPNPVRQVPEVAEPQALPRAIEAETLRRIFAALPPGRTTARLEVLRWTGLPAKTLMRLRPADVDLVRGVMWLPGRRKGQGTSAKVLPLLPQAVRAFRALERCRAWGPYSTSAMHALFRRACQKAGVTVAVSPYQLRHTFATAFLRATGDLRATQHALDHSTPRLTERYALSAVDPALAAAYQRMAKATRHVTAKVTGRRMRP